MKPRFLPTLASALSLLLCGTIAVAWAMRCQYAGTDDEQRTMDLSKVGLAAFIVVDATGPRIFHQMPAEAAGVGPTYASAMGFCYATFYAQGTWTRELALPWWSLAGLTAILPAARLLMQRGRRCAVDEPMIPPSSFSLRQTV